MTGFIALASSAALLLAAGLAPASAQAIGKAGAVNPAASGAAPGGSVRTLNVGENVVHRHRVTTAASGSVQLVFVDRSTFSVGPNSDLVIDEFVYDPSAGTGRMAATLTKGVMRFVGGQASHTGGATIKTPATTLGVRGGIVTVRHDSVTGTHVISHFGRLIIQTAQGPEVIRRPGFTMTVANRTQQASAPQRVTRTEVAGAMRDLTSKGTQVGGRRENPADSGQSRLVGQVNAGLNPLLIEGQRQNVAQAAQIVTERQPVAAPPPIVTAATTTAAQDTASVHIETPAPVVTDPTPPSPPSPPPARWYALETTAMTGEVIPAAFVSPGTWSETPVVVYGAGGTNPDGSHNTNSRMFGAGLVINGQGSAQTSTIYLATADLFPEGSNGTATPGGGLFATTRLAANQSMGRLATAITPIPGTSVYDVNYSLESGRINQNEYVNGVLTNTSGYYPGGGGASGSVTFDQTVARTANPAGLGAYRPIGMLYGYAGGLLRTDSITTGSAVGPSRAVVGTTSIEFTNSSRFSAGIAVGAVGTGSGTADDFSSASYLFGYQGGGTRTRSAYVDYDYFGARSAARNTTNDQALSQIALNNGGRVVTASREWNLMVNGTKLGVETFFPGVNFCQCEYTRWGFWSVDSRREGTSADGGVDPSVRDRLHMGTWIAGVPTPASQIPTVGIATFSGHAIGSFKSGTYEYIAAGNFNQTVNFATNSGTFAIPSLDGRSYTGTVALGSDRSLFSGSGSASGAAMATAGRFYNGPAGPARELGGAFTVQGTGPAPYIGSGTFAAKQ